jgi:hypothetical protein
MRFFIQILYVHYLYLSRAEAKHPLPRPLKGRGLQGAKAPAVIILLLALFALGAASKRWGFDSSEKIDSPEWERRRQWRGGW